MKQKKIVVSIVVALSILVSTFILIKSKSATSNRDYKQIEQTGVLHIVTNLDPIQYFVDADSISGFVHDMLQAMQVYSDLKFDIKLENSLEKSLEGLSSGKYDVVARTIPAHAGLKTKYSFTEPIIYNRFVLIQRKSEYNGGIKPIRNHLDLAKKTIHTSKDSPSLFRVENLAKEIGDTIFIVQDSVYEANQLALMVATGDIDYSICDFRTAEFLAARIPEIDIKTDIGFTHIEAWAVRETSSILLDSLNQWILRFKDSKKYDQIYRKYYK